MNFDESLEHKDAEVVDKVSLHPIDDILENLAVKIRAIQGESAHVQAIKQGHRTIDNYCSVGSLKYLSFDDKLLLIRKILNNARIGVHDLVDMDNTVGPSILHSPEEQDAGIIDISILSQPEVIRDFDEIIGGIQGLENSSLVTDLLLKLPHSVARGIADLLWKQLLKMKPSAMLDVEKIVIAVQSFRFIQNYGKALSAGGFEGSIVNNLDPLLRLVSQNQRKLAHQTVTDRHNITSSDHGMRHLVQSNLTISHRLADLLSMVNRMTPQQRVFLQQAVVEHDLGYAITLLANYGISDSRIPPGKGYYDLLNDHPLFSCLLFDEQKEDLIALFGVKGFEAIRACVLDHEEVKHSLLAKDDCIVQAVFSRADCLGVAADIKMMQLFEKPKVMAEMGRALQLKLWAEELAEDSPQRALVLDMLVATRANMLSVVSAETHESPEISAAYVSAVERFFDPQNQAFLDYTATKNFGSYCLSFHSIQGIDELCTMTAVYEINPIFSLLRRYFSTSGAKQADAIRTNAIVHLLEDFGYRVPDVSILAEVIDAIPEGEILSTTQLLVEGVIEQSPCIAREKFVFMKSDGNHANPLIDQWLHILKREISVKDAFDCASDSSRSMAELKKKVHNMKIFCRSDYQVGAETSIDLMKQIIRLLQLKEREKVAELLLKLWLQGV